MIKLLNLKEIHAFFMTKNKKGNNLEEYAEIINTFTQFYEKMNVKSRRENSKFWNLNDMLY